MGRVVSGSIGEMRVSISFAALFVNVTARTPPGVTLPVWISQAMRVVSTRVLPEPAPARISADWSGRVTAASCSGLRFSRRFCIRAFVNARFYRGTRSGLELHSDLVRILRQIGLGFQRVDDGFRVFLGCEAREAHVIDTRVSGFLGKEFRRIARAAQGVVRIEGLARFLEAGREDPPLPAAGRNALAGLLLGLCRPLLELLG